MQITLQQSKLAKALSYIAKAVSTKPNIPVLSNVLLSVDKSTLKLSATNLDMGINMWIAGQSLADGEVTVSAKTLGDFVSETSDGKITLTVDGQLLKVVGEGSQAEFQTIPATEFPILPKITGTPVFSVAPDIFVTGLSKVLFACSTENTPGKSQQTGVYFDLPKTGDLNLIGLDGYRLSSKKIKVRRALEQELTAIVPGKALSELSKILLSEESVEVVEVYVNQSKSQMMFKFNEIEFSVRLLEGPYPEYKKVIPTEFDYSCEMNRNEFLQAIRIVNTFARSTLGNRTNFDLDPDSATVTLSTTVTDLGNNETKIKATQIKGDELAAAYNLRYLGDVGNVVTGDKIIFQTKNALAAAVFLDGDDPDFLHIVMPLRREG